MTILAIDTSCDDTSVAVTEKSQILSNVISSQVKDHAEFGGVVPFLAQRLHKERIDAVIEMALKEAGKEWKDMNAIAVTYGPGLAPALEVGIQKAQELGELHGKPVYKVNHMLGHMASCFTEQAPLYPLLSLLVSGGHSELIFARSFGDVTVIGQTLDDALGEAYDKVARMLGLGYPGGKIVADLAAVGNPDAYDLPIPMLRSGDLNLSYSGLKNAVRLLILEQEPLDDAKKADIAASFERVAQASVLKKVEKALEMYPEVQQLALGGGVAANKHLRAILEKACTERGVTLLIPPTMSLCTDNAAMIGVAAWFGIEAGQQPVTEKIDRIPYLTVEDPL
ncbi:MAG: tRNA (adenosine(37)-N6)-threonylcarbamoyltransferase complex transferase subunit TsaD [Candidatus Paceibacterota bacterium]